MKVKRERLERAEAQSFFWACELFAAFPTQRAASFKNKKTKRFDRFKSELLVALLLLLLFHLTSRAPGRAPTMRFLPKQRLCHRTECTSAKSLRCLKVFARLHSSPATFHFPGGVQDRQPHFLCSFVFVLFLVCFMLRQPAFHVIPFTSSIRIPMVFLPHSSAHTSLLLLPHTYIYLYRLSPVWGPRQHLYLPSRSFSSPPPGVNPPPNPHSLAGM